jgi:hypothetical protein
MASFSALASRNSGTSMPTELQEESIPSLKLAGREGGPASRVVVGAALRR